MLLLLVPVMAFLTGYALGVRLTTRTYSVQYRQKQITKKEKSDKKKNWYQK